MPIWLEHLKQRLTSSEARLAVMLAIFSVLLAICYFLFNFVMVQTPELMARPSALLIKELPFWSFMASIPNSLPTDKYQMAFYVVLFNLAAFSIYGFAAFLTWKHKGTPVLFWLVIASAVVFFLISVFSLPNITTNLYNYMLRAHVAATYDSNPYYVAADEYPDNPIYPYANTNYTHEPGGKLPAWMIISIPLAKLAGDDVVTNLFVYRTAFFLFGLINIALIVLVLRKLCPQCILSGIILYAWNPIVVLYGQCKIDTVMAFYLLTGIVFLVYGRERLATSFFVLSVLTKLVTGPLLVVHWLRYFVQKRWREGIVSALVIGLTAAILYGLFWDGPNIILGHASQLGEGGTYEESSKFAPYLFRGVFILLILRVVFTHSDDLRVLLRGWTLLMLYFCLFITKLGSADYLITLIGLMSISADWRLVLVTVATALSSLTFQIWHKLKPAAAIPADLVEMPRMYAYLAAPGMIVVSIGAVYLWKRYRTSHYSD